MGILLFSELPLFKSKPTLPFWNTIEWRELAQTNKQKCKLRIACSSDDSMCVSNVNDFYFACSPFGNVHPYTHKYTLYKHIRLFIRHRNKMASIKQECKTIHIFDVRVAGSWNSSKMQKFKSNENMETQTHTNQLPLQ